MQVRNFAADLSAMRFIYADIALRRADADFDYLFSERFHIILPALLSSSNLPHKSGVSSIMP